jgi:small conductance mechanosensitive channel
MIWNMDWSLIGMRALQTLVAMISSYFVVKFTKKQIDLIGRAARMPAEIRDLFGDIARFFIYFAAFYIILVIWDATSLIIPIITGAGVIGLAIGFASKDVVSNFIAGIFVLLDKPFRVGDTIAVKYGVEVKGKVTKIGLRSTRLKTEDGVTITIPNSVFTSQIIKKWKG